MSWLEEVSRVFTNHGEPGSIVPLRETSKAAARLKAPAQVSGWFASDAQISAWREDLRRLSSDPPAPSMLASSPVTVDEEIDEMMASEYGRLAEKIGYAPPVPADHALRKFLSAEGIEQYDGEMVMKFLRSIAPKVIGGRAEVVWLPLRDADKKPWNTIPYHPPRYFKAVPYHVLSLVDRLLSKAPSGMDLNFTVSDYQAVNPDPFLRVQDGPSPAIVIAHWDEPGWGEWKKVQEKSDDVGLGKL